VEAGSDGTASSSGAGPGADSGSSSGASDGGGFDAYESSVPDSPPAPCPPPTFDPPSGSVFPATVTITDPVVTAAGGFIYYTTDGTNPTVYSSAYAGPIPDVGGETFRAVAKSPTCSISDVSVAVYTIDPPDCCGALVIPPTLTPSSKTSDDDFLVQATYNPAGATLCYTLDGSVPTCAANGTCSGTTRTYEGATWIPIDGQVTNAATGQVTVEVMACVQGWAPSPVTMQVYTLQAAPPTMTNPGPGTTFAADAGAITPTLASDTVSSLAVVDPVSIQTTAGSATPPTCATGTANTNPTTLSITADTSLQAITCKPGYLPSAVMTFDYAFSP
jgi:hypothetical protein